MQSKGTEVVDLLQYLCSNDVDVPVGSIIHTGMQNSRGGYENDCSLARIAVNQWVFNWGVSFVVSIAVLCSTFSYMMIAPTIQQTRCKHWISRHSPKNGTVVVSDVTSAYTAICIIGPYSRPLLSELTDTDLCPKNFPFFTFKVLKRISHIVILLLSKLSIVNLIKDGWGFFKKIFNDYFSTWFPVQELKVVSISMDCV